MTSKHRALIVIATLVFIAVVAGLGNSGGKKTAVTVKQVNPAFDSETVAKLQGFFPVQFDLNNLGRPNPFQGI